MALWGHRLPSVMKTSQLRKNVCCLEGRFLLRKLKLQTHWVSKLTAR